MGLFKKKKQVPKETLHDSLAKVIKSHDREIENYIRMKATIGKLVAKYRTSLTTSAYIHGDGITLYIKHMEGYPDGFFAFADKLGLNVEPICGSGYASRGENRQIIIRAKDK